MLSLILLKDFVRVRVGIGRPERGDVADYVLQSFTAVERNMLQSTVYPMVQRKMDELIKASLQGDSIATPSSPPSKRRAVTPVQPTNTPKEGDGNAWP